MRKQCVPGSFFSAHALEPGNVEYLDPSIVSRKQRVGYRVGQGFVSRNASRNTRGRVQGEVLLVPLISRSNEATSLDDNNLHVPCRQSSKHFISGQLKVISLFRYSAFYSVPKKGGGGGGGGGGVILSK